jgi:hypothetical protein
MLRAHCRRQTIVVALIPPHQRRADDELRLRPQLEALEPRFLMTASAGADWQNLLSAGGICNCSICTGQGLPHLTATETAGGTEEGVLALSNPLSSIPQLSSNAGATAKLFLDFNGHTQASWGNWTNVVTPVYDRDGDRTTFSDGELASIQEIWARVAEDYASFNIDVTTIDPGGSANGVVARIAIGGNYSDWFGNSAGGVAYIGGFYNSAPNVGYVFEDALGNGNARYVSEAASHEAGHLFGLLHQALWNGNTLEQSYYQGNSAWAPIMGVGYYSQRTTWYNGTTDDGPSEYQDDMSILADASNGFGYRADDFGGTQALASALAASVNIAGRIGTNTDQDWFSFSTTGGTLNLSLNVAQFGANLDSILELRDSAGTLLVSANPTTSLSASLSSTLASGTYFVVVKSSGGYGNVGQYTLTGVAPVNSGGGSGGEDTSAPEIDVLLGATELQSGGAINFGSLQVGQTADRTITFRNSGDAPLTVNTPLALHLPAGYSIVSNITQNTLAPGESTSLTIRFAPTSAGTLTGLFNVFNSDGDEGTFGIQLTGVATAATAPEIAVSLGTTNISSGGTLDFSSVRVGQSITRTLTFRNTGNATLTISQPLAAHLPPGYSIATPLSRTTLLTGQSATLTIRFAPTSVGTHGGVFNVFNNDADEGVFGINFTGTATAAPVIRAIDNGAAGFTTTGTWSRKTYVGREKDIQIAAKGTGSTTATWTFTNLPAGQYRVHASWTGSVYYASNSPFTVFDGDAALGTVSVNQERASSGLSWSGTNWSNLGIFNISGGTIRVQLTNAANDRVVADAVRIERIGDVQGASAAAGSTLVDSLPEPAHQDTQSPFIGFAPLLASTATSNSGQDGNGLSPSAVDSLFTAEGDSRAELLLLDDALDLLNSTAKAAGRTGSSGSASSELTADPIGDNWLMGDELDVLLK